MIVTLQTTGIKTLEQVRGFVEGNQAVSFVLNDRRSAHRWLMETLMRFRYEHGSKVDKGLLRAYVCKITGLSRAQVTRLIAQYYRDGRIEDRRKAPAKPFATRYTPDDIRLLAETDALHSTLSGPATRKLCERMLKVFGDQRFERLAGISNGHLYNLRQHKTYRGNRTTLDKTRPVRVNMGERRKPAPDGLPGYLRVDSVHQGDLDGIKGLYLITAVDEVTQFECVFAVERISEHFLLPALEQLLATFPFSIRNFHSDNGSEYINRNVAALLEKLRIEQTKSRSRQTNDNALVESKNGSTVRKHLGYSHIPGRYAQQVNVFASQILTPYLNFHRPCFFPTEITDAKGKLRKKYRYEDMMTPYEKLKSLAEAHRYLKPGITFEQMDAIANECSDNEVARRLNQARAELFQFINQSQRSAG
jgi:transposase InsO family protein